MKWDSKKFLVGAVVVFIAFIALLVLFIVYLPEMLGTPAGTRIFTNLVNKKQENVLKVESINFSWTKGQTIEGVQILNPQNEELFRCDVIYTASSLWNLMVKRKEGQEIHLVGPIFYLNPDLFEEDLDLSFLNTPHPKLPFFGKIVFENASFKTRPNAP